MTAMPRPPIDLPKYVRLIPQHTGPLAQEASAPIAHYQRASNDAWNLIPYLERNLNKAGVYSAVAERHLQSIRIMVLLSIVEGFERFLKELAAVCIDMAGTSVADDRLDIF